MKFIARILALFAVIAWSLPAAAASLNGSGPISVNGSFIPGGMSASPSSTPQFQVGTRSQAMFWGLNAGLSFPASPDDYGTIGVGSQALSKLTTTGAEDTCVGGWSCQFLTGLNDTGFGMHALGSETSANNDTGLGNDALRDAVSGGGNTAVGVHAAAHGAPGSVVAVGLNAMNGNSAGVLISGTKTTNDVITITLSASGSTPGTVTGLPVSLQYTVLAGDTIATIASSLSALLTNGAITGPSYQVGSDSTSFADGTAVVSFYFPGTTTVGWAITVASSCSGTCTETLTNLPGANFTGSTAIGRFALFAPGANGTVPGVTAVGDSACKTIVTNGLDTCIGFGAGLVATTGQKDVFVGYSAGTAVTTSSGDVLIGFQAGDKITTGGNNTIIGQGVASTTLATGAGNIIIGFNPNCDTSGSNTGNTIEICGNSAAIWSATGTNTASTSATTIAGTLAEAGITTDSGQTATATVCEDTTTHQFYFGSGTAGICKGTSSLRFKENVAPLDHGLADLMQLDTIAYNYRPGIGLDSSRRLYGFSAEQMNSVLPELVYSDAQGPTSIDWAGVVPILVHAIQEQQREIEQLRADR